MLIDFISLIQISTQFFTFTTFLVQQFTLITTFPTYGIQRQNVTPDKSRKDDFVFPSWKNVHKDPGRIAMTEEKSKHYFTQALLSCHILLVRKERTESRGRCCHNLLISNIDREYFHIFCYFCKSYLDDMFIPKALLNNFCSQNVNINISQILAKYFEIYNQKKKWKDIIHTLHKRDVRSKDQKMFNSTLQTTEGSLYITKREVNTTGNSTIPGIPDWETILQMQYSKDPQWALICVVFVVTLVLGCVWYCGMCNGGGIRHEYIDPVVTHNIKPEFVKDLVTRKAKFLAWFKYLKSRRKEYEQTMTAETEQLMSSTDEEDVFDQTEMTNF